jgi:hypothetical protein
MAYETYGDCVYGQGTYKGVASAARDERPQGIILVAVTQYKSVLLGTIPRNGNKAMVLNFLSESTFQDTVTDPDA